jgi:predicted aspartyl protease
MGMFQVNVRVTNPKDSSRFFEEKFWVDTGAFISLIPEDRLEQVGIVPMRTRSVISADGRPIKCLQAEAVLAVAEIDESATCPVLFGPKGSLYLLGATALELFAVQADPTTQTLKPVAVIQA